MSPALAIADVVSRRSDRRTASGGSAFDMALAGLSGREIATRFRRWQGRSASRYLFSVFPLHTGCPLVDGPVYADSVLLAVRRRPDGSRAVLHAEDSGPLPELVLGGEALRAAIMDGANEIHVHLLAKDAAARAAIIADLMG